MTVQAAQDARIDVSLCGEMAGDVLYTILLVGMGIERLSMAPAAIPDVKKLVRSISFEQARAINDAVASMKTSAEIERYLHEQLRDIAVEFAGDIGEKPDATAG